MNTCSHNHHDFKANNWLKHLAIVSSLDPDLRDVAVVETLVDGQDAMVLILRVPTWWDKAEFIPISCVGILHSLTKDHQHTTLKNKQNNDHTEYLEGEYWQLGHCSVEGSPSSSKGAFQTHAQYCFDC